MKPTPEQQAKAKERRERFRAIVKQVAEMSDEQKAHITAKIGAVLTCDGHALSLHNTLLLLIQCPTVSMVGGFRQWIKAGRAVKKGEHGHMLWFPKGNGKPIDQPAEPTASATDKPHIHFLIGTVFDISQTQEI